ncbi:hypothetical protein PAHAL_5G439900 [Panicum hallii]|uniref:Uncharacterized protein n=1 Tax=Panicum hallii TaxID=206008 RepID=A0A2S3HWX5_9POAL|nr:uncharacterized protein LOC112891805 isoform X1 [Panicum hallii]PAN31716.1 hypothetical protein PAHAL_5G439900 [Panicum hallii]
MALLCFLLDLRNIPPPLLHRLKQCLLHLANLYAAATPPPQPHASSSADAGGLPDRLALSYVHAPSSRSSSSSSSSWPELKIGYRPGEKFSLRDFHHAVNNIPLDGFLHDQHGGPPPTGDVSLTDLFSNRAIYSWATDDISKKVIAICISAQDTEALRRSLMNAAEQCVAVEFIMLELEAAFMYGDVPENANSFVNRICDLENCVVRRYNPETQVLHGLVKRWLEELKDDMEETPQAVFLFRYPIINSVKHIYCNFYASANQITDGFPSCQACRCHGRPIDLVTPNKIKWTCPITSRQLAASDVTDTAVRIGEQTVLFLPTSEGGSNLQRVSASISFDVIERTELASMNEGVIMGRSFVVIPCSNDVEVALTDESSDQNTQIFYGLCETLFRFDQGLVCSSSCNIETMKIGTLQCYYLLQPSEKGPMLLRRLAGSEEILPLPDVSRDRNSKVTMEIKKSVETSLSKIALKDYNPLQHERGFHSKLNLLVKDSLQFGSIDPDSAPKDPYLVDSFSEPQIPTCQGLEGSRFLNQPEENAEGLNDHLHSFSEPQTSTFRTPKENKLSNQSKKGKASPSISEEWEKFIIIDDLDDDLATPAAPRPTANKPPRAKPPSPVKPLDEKTSRILERLEPPRAKKQRPANAGKASTKAAPAPGRVAGTQNRKPLLPVEPSASQPLKPTFNRLRRKLNT